MDEVGSKHCSYAGHPRRVLTSSSASIDAAAWNMSWLQVIICVTCSLML